MAISDKNFGGISPEILNALKGKASSAKGIEKEITDFVNNRLSSEQAVKLQSILENKEATDALLSSPEARKLFNMLIGENNNE